MDHELRLEMTLADVDVELPLGHRQRQRRSPVERLAERGDEGAIELDDRDLRGAMDAVAVQLAEHLRDAAVRVERGAAGKLVAAVQPLGRWEPDLDPGGDPAGQVADE